MILIHPAWQFEIKVKEFNTLIIENTELFRDIITEFDGQMKGEEGKFLLIDNLKEKKISGELVLVHSPFDVGLNERKILNRVFTDVEKDIVGMEIERYAEIESMILQFMENILLNSSIDLEINDSIRIADFLKMVGLKIYEEKTSIVEKITNYTRTVGTFLQPSAIVFVNTRFFFTEIELANFVNEMKLAEIGIIMLEHYNDKLSIPGENLYTIDKDLCEIY